MEALQSYTNTSSSAHVVFRTSGFFDGKAKRRNTALVDHMNQRAMDAIDNNNPNNHPRLSYIDWGGAVAARSHGSDRIGGDHVAHYGTEPRLVLWQMTINHLRDMSVE